MGSLGMDPSRVYLHLGFSQSCNIFKKPGTSEFEARLVPLAQLHIPHPPDRWILRERRGFNMLRVQRCRL